jgi:hypothetical protein
MGDRRAAGRGRYWSEPRPLPSQPDDNTLDLFGSLGSGLASVFKDVEQHLTHVASSANNLLPILEENGQDDARPPNTARQASQAGVRRPGTRNAAGPRNMLVASNSGIAFTLDNGTASPTVLSTASGKSQGTHQSSKASGAQTAVSVARFGGAAEDRAKLRAHGRSKSLPSGAMAANAESAMLKNLPGVADGSMKLLKRKDSCDKATRSKIDRWMSTATAPPEQESDSSAESGLEKDEDGRQTMPILQFPRIF